MGTIGGELDLWLNRSFSGLEPDNDVLKKFLQSIIYRRPLEYGFSFKKIYEKFLSNAFYLIWQSENKRYIKRLWTMFKLISEIYLILVSFE